MAKKKKAKSPKATKPAFRSGYPPLIERTWAAWEALRRLGFAADDIYVLQANEDQIFVHLERPDGKEFNVEIGHLGTMPVEQFRELWERFAAELNAGKFSWENGLEPIFLQWLGEVGGGTMLVLAIKNKGIALPSENVDFGERVIH